MRRTAAVWWSLWQYFSLKHSLHTSVGLVRSKTYLQYVKKKKQQQKNMKARVLGSYVHTKWLRLTGVKACITDIMPLCTAPLYKVYIVQWYAILHYVCEPTTLVEKIETFRNFCCWARWLLRLLEDESMEKWGIRPIQETCPTAPVKKIPMNALKLWCKQTIPRAQKFDKIHLSCGFRTQSKYSIEYAWSVILQC